MKVRGKEKEKRKRKQKHQRIATKWTWCLYANCNHSRLFCGTFSQAADSLWITMINCGVFVVHYLACKQVGAWELVVFPVILPLAKTDSSLNNTRDVYRIQHCFLCFLFLLKAGSRVKSNFLKISKDTNASAQTNTRTKHNTIHNF